MAELFRQCALVSLWVLALLVVADSASEHWRDRALITQPWMIVVPSIMTLVFGAAALLTTLLS